MTFKHPSHLIAIASLVIAFISGIIIISCSQKPTQYLLRNSYAPAGFTTVYSLEAKRTGKTFKNDSLYREFDSRIEGKINYTTTEILDNGNYMVREDNQLSWDEPVGDSGQMKRQTREYSYLTEITARGHVIDVESTSENSATWLNYTRNFYEQGYMVFPEQPVGVGYQWTQSVDVTLPDSTVDTAATTYKVKGAAKKAGYDCVIIDYTGNLVLPIFPSPQEQVTGVDRIECSGLYYFANKEGYIVSIEERRKYNADRHIINDKDEYNLDTEFESIMSLKLDSVYTSK